MYQRVYKWFGIQIGVEYNMLTMRDDVTIFEKSKPRWKKYYSSGGFTFPLLLNASYYFNERHGMDISLGGALLILPSNIATGGFVQTRHPYEKDGIYGYRYDHETPFNFSWYGKIGYQFMFTNKNTLGVALVGSYAKVAYAESKYFIYLNRKSVSLGYSSLRNTFIGLQFSYGFTVKKLLCVY
jgi:hypothetical protein